MARNLQTNLLAPGKTWQTRDKLGKNVWSERFTDIFVCSFFNKEADTIVASTQYLPYIIFLHKKFLSLKLRCI